MIATLEVATSLRNKMRVRKSVARVLANAFYGLDLYAGCHDSSLAKEARAITIHRAFLMGGLNDKNQITPVGVRMLVSYRKNNGRSDGRYWHESKTDGMIKSRIQEDDSNDQATDPV